jgi:hypothetical protein
MNISHSLNLYFPGADLASGLHLKKLANIPGDHDAGGLDEDGQIITDFDIQVFQGVVGDEVMTLPPPMSTRTLAMIMPSFTSTTLPFKMFLVLSCRIYPSLSDFSANR